MPLRFVEWRLLMATNPHEFNLYQLAENLSRPVYELKRMPVSEYFGWLRFYQARSEQQEKEERKAKGDLMASDSNADFVKAMMK